MPPLPRLRIAALEELAKQLRFAPVETLRRQLHRAEALAAELDGGINYPAEWVVYRITGYRPEEADGSVIVGEALLADISALVERLSTAAGLRETDLESGRYIGADELCRRWSVSRKTLDRYRRRGLVALRVIGDHGKPRLAFELGAVERFQADQRVRLSGAASFSRVGADVEARILRRAAAYARLGCSRNQAAARIAKRYGRGHETVRQLLKRHESTSPKPMFVDRGPPDQRERELIERATFANIEPAVVAAKLDRPVASIQRVAADRRAARLRSLLEGEHAIGRSNGAVVRDAAKVLTLECVTAGLGGPGELDLAALLNAARATPAAAAAVERGRAEAYQCLIGRAATAIASLPMHGAKPPVIDCVETDLRWAARLKAELVRSQLGLVLRTIEAGVGRPAEELRAGELARLVQESIGAVAAAVDDFHADRGGRLAAPAGIAVNRIVAKHQRLHPRETNRSRAAPLVASGTAVPDWTLRIARWQSWGGRAWLEPAPGVRRGIETLGEREIVVLRLRYGWGARPHTLAEVAAIVGVPVMRLLPLERRALRSAGAGRGERIRTA